MKMKVVIFLVDHYSYPLRRQKTVKYRHYKCGLEPLLMAIEPFRPLLNIETRLFLTGGPANDYHAVLFDYIHDSLDNSLQDFSGYLAAAIYAQHTLAGSSVLPIFCNSSCPPRYLQILIESIYSLSLSRPDLSNKVIAPAFSYLFREGCFWHYKPHFQSYCFCAGHACLPFLVSFIQSQSTGKYQRKKDYISRLEVGLSSRFMENTSFEVFRAAVSSIKKPTIWEAVLDNPFSIIDPRLAPSSLALPML
jgi:hypothetical protein